MRSDYDLLIDKLDAFIRKFYKDRVIRGGLYSIALIVLVFLMAVLLEYLGRFGSTARTLLFWSAVVAMLVILGRFVLVPLVNLFRMGDVISHAEAARIVGIHFAEVQDKLLNTLQLREMASLRPDQRALLEAAIAQRSRELGPVPFANAIDLRRNTRYLRYALPPVVLLLALLFAAPGLITGPTQRLIRHGNEFVPEAPFRFILMGNDLRVREQDDIEVMVELQGEVVPQQVLIILDEKRIPLVKKDGRHFIHRFRNVQADQSFHFEAEGQRSQDYTLVMVPDPMLLDLSIELAFPAYLGRPNEIVTSTGDVVVPAGTRLTWQVNTRSSDRLDMVFDDTTLVLGPVARSVHGQLFRTARRVMQGLSYRMLPSLGQGQERTTTIVSDAMVHRIEVVPDLYPTIGVESRVDSTAPKRLFYRGEIGDDHGIRRLVFHYRFSTGGDSLPPELRSAAEDIRIDPRMNRQEFFHSWDLYDLPIGPGDRVEYWFEVWDNDGVNGSKSTRSMVGVFAAPTRNELAEQRERDQEAIKSELKDGIREAQELQRELDKLRRDMLEKKELNWQDQQRLQNAMDRQEELRQRIERNSEKMRQSLQQQREFQQMDERLLEKQLQVQELFENVLSEEMKDLYRKVQELMEKLDKDLLQEQVKDMKLGQEDIEKELDRALEQLKQLEVEQKAEDIIRQLEELAEKQDRLGEESREGKLPNEELKARQDELTREFNELRKDMDDLREKNSELERPLDLPGTEPLEEEIHQDQESGAEQLDREQNQKAGQKQKSAAEKMEQLAFQMQSAMASNSQEQQEEDMDALRQLLENIVQLSFDQEAVMEQVMSTNIRDPRFMEHGRQQRKLRDDAKVIEDSLFALSKRVPQLQSIVNREMNAVNDNMDEATQLLGEARANERYRPMAADKQQQAMTSLNNLALLLDEALQQMMQQMMQMGGGSCNNPKPGKPGQGQGTGVAKMKAQQQALQKQLEEMRKALEKGGKKPGEKPGEKDPGGMGMPGMSQQLAQLAAQQAAIRKEMQRLAQELNKDGSGAGNALDRAAEQMEQIERDIVNRNISQETMRRQQDIMTRLLEHEKAERERELDEQRTSNEGMDRPPPDPAKFFDYQRRKARESELLRTVPPGLKPYYRDRVNAYFGTFDRP